MSIDTVARWIRGRATDRPDRVGACLPKSPLPLVTCLRLLTRMATASCDARRLGSRLTRVSLASSPLLSSLHFTTEHPDLLRS